MSSVPQEVSEFIKEKHLIPLITTDNFSKWVTFFEEQIMPDQFNFFLQEFVEALFIAHLESISLFPFCSIYPDFHLDICPFPNSLDFGAVDPS